MIELVSTVPRWTWHNFNLCKTVGLMLKFAGINPKIWKISIEITQRARMRSLNTHFRGQARTTDILSFRHTTAPFSEFSQSSAKDSGAVLGEIVLCYPFVAGYKDPLRPSAVDFRIERLLAHGICHLIGLDHENISQYKIMHSVECRMLCSLRRKIRPRPGRYSLYLKRNPGRIKFTK